MGKWKRGGQRLKTELSGGVGGGRGRIEGVVGGYGVGGVG